MAQATSTPVTPKQMGNHLRSLRRRKGLSLSEVARGAGLNRRELVNYERGKTTIPESDLWVLAGSIGVDVGELVPPTPTGNLPAVRNDATTGSVTDAVAMLRRSAEHEDASPHLGTLRVLQQLPEGKRIPVKTSELAAIAKELGGEPGAIELQLQEILGIDPLEAARIRAMLLDDTHGRRRKAKALGAAEAAPAARYSAPVVAAASSPNPAPGEHEPVDVFEELARLPEPLPLPDESTVPDMLAAPPTLENAVELVDGTFPTLGTGFGFNLTTPAMAESTAATAATGASAARNSGADAPPIDVTPRSPDEWGWTEPAPGAPLVDRDTPGAGAGSGDDWPAPDDGPAVAAWPATAPAAAPGPGAPDPVAFWQGTDDWTPTDAEHELTDAELASADSDALWGFAAASAEPWSAVAATNDPAVELVETGPIASELVDSPWITPVADDAPPHDPGTFGPWDHDVDPAAVSSGFIVDWGEAPDAVSDDTIASGPGQWAGAGTWDEPLAPTWEVHSDGTEATEPPAAPVEGDAYDAFLADPFASTTETCDPVDTLDPVDTVEYDAGDHLDDHLDHTENSTEDDAVSADFSFGSDLAAALAATYLPDAADTLAPDTHATDTDATDIDEFSDPSVFPFVADPYAADALPIEAEVVEVVEVDEVDEVEVAEDAPEPTDDDATGAAPDDEPDTTGERHVDDLPPIVWRADAFGNVDAVEPIDAVTTITEADLEPVEEIHEDVFVTAGSDWLLGNAVPLVEVQAAGALVMRRADERWALADVNTGTDFALEVEVDFLSGPGLGVLFRASVDDEGRMSGYSFDVDPIYDGGGYLVRQWQDDRELWNPIARVKADDPSAMYGKLTVRIEVNGEQLRVAMNGAEVLVVDDLEQASRERDRGPATGDRVGVQAWSSSDLVIDALRVASR